MDEEKEIWKIYHKGARVTWEVSNYGHAKRNGAIYDCKIGTHGYLIFGNGYTVHRAVATLFVENPNNYNEIDHIDGNPQNNNYLNLRWCTHKQNCNNLITLKRKSETRKGEKNPMYGSGEKNPMYGKNHSEQTKAKMSAARKGRSWFLGSDGKRHWV